MTQTQEQKLQLAVDLYRLRLEQARVDLAGYMMNLKKKLDKEARFLKEGPKQKLAEQSAVLDEMAMILITEEPELGFDFNSFLFDLFEDKESVYG